MAAKRKNSRKKKKNQVQVPFPVLLANVLVLVAVLGLSYMWLCARCDALGQQIKNKEAELAVVERRCNNEEGNWAKMKSTPNLRAAILRFGLNMRMPSETQIVKLGQWDIAEETAMTSDSQLLLRQ